MRNAGDGTVLPIKLRNPKTPTGFEPISVPASTFLYDGLVVGEEGVAPSIVCRPFVTGIPRMQARVFPVLDSSIRFYLSPYQSTIFIMIRLNIDLCLSRTNVAYRLDSPLRLSFLKGFDGLRLSQRSTF